MFSRSLIAEWSLLSLVHGIRVCCTCMGAWQTMRNTCRCGKCFVDGPMSPPTTTSDKLGCSSTRLEVHFVCIFPVCATIGRFRTVVHYNSRNVNEFLSGNLMWINMKIIWIRKNRTTDAEVPKFNYLLCVLSTTANRIQLEYSFVHVAPIQIASDSFWGAIYSLQFFTFFDRMEIFC